MEIKICLFVIWILAGGASFIYWWTKDYSFTLGIFFLCLLVSLSGPFAFFLGWVIHGDLDSDPVFFKKRK